MYIGFAKEDNARPAAAPRSLAVRRTRFPLCAERAAAVRFGSAVIAVFMFLCFELRSFGIAI